MVSEKDFKGTGIAETAPGNTHGNMWFRIIFIIRKKDAEKQKGETNGKEI